ncbi:hypothetical protein CCR75_007396 [Bremia lactucae]|uniref:Myosin-like protein n=1 Tax=Bremia lactucae TaxID=4779 RepID=A0A976IK73_BRELC|nr:hypothetical protein CCR75_007396 [Bremia lactucae]
MDVGAHVWVSDPTDESVWLAARILDTQHTTLTLEIESPRKVKSTGSHFKRTCDDNDDIISRNVDLVFAASGECINILPRNRPCEQDQRDLVALPHLHEASILNALRLRYERNAIYTQLGDILVSINPFQDLPHLYADEVLQSYAHDHKAGYSDLVAASDLREPHLFAVARAAYMDIVQNGRSQSILISGESGAGKTEATKIMMTYFAVTCGTSHTSTASSNPLEVNPALELPSRTTIEEQVLQSNPILEAFGNARTVRNDNSSRFGKFIELRFRDQRQRLAGARIRTYLLEKIRVIKQAPHERNFHIFYELLSADEQCVTKEQRNDLALNGGSEGFRLLNQSSCCKRRDGVKDAVQFRSTMRAMQQLGMSDQEICGVLKIVAAVLHLGNVEFEQVPYKRENNVFVDVARVKSSISGACDHFTKTAELLGVPTEALDHAITKRWLYASNETLVVGVDVAQARNTRNALTMECYRRLFEWLVARVNAKIQRQATGSWDAERTVEDDENDSNSFIGLLDIFGFEDMAENSFEQLCINYANEALQHQFNQYIFEEEQRLYREEGIQWSFVDFPNNRACLELFEHRPIGIFSLTDQECVFPQGTDRALVAKYYLEFEKKKPHPHFCSAPVIQRTTQFIVAHYAGSVTYTVEGFLAKNKDSLCESAAQLLARSSNPLVRALAAGSANAVGANGDSDLDGNSRNRRRAKSTIAAVSVGTQFKIQLNELMTAVRATIPRYVRCIKPNDSHKSLVFQSTRVVEQLRSGGVLEAVRVARAGFPVRLFHKQFLERYRRVLLSLSRLKDENFNEMQKKGTELDLCLLQLTRVLLAGSKSDEELESVPRDGVLNRQISCGVSIGKTRVFFRRKPFERIEKLRAAVRQEASLSIQRHVRGFMARRDYRQFRRVTISMQAFVRGRRAYRHVCWIRTMQQARVLQARMRQLCARSKFLRARAGVRAVQCRFRCRLAIRFVQAIRETLAVTRIAAAWRRSFAQRSYRNLCGATLALQCAFRGRRARKILKVLRKESRNVAKLKIDNALLKDELAELRRQLQAFVHSVSNEGLSAALVPTIGGISKEAVHPSPQNVNLLTLQNFPARASCKNQLSENKLEIKLSDDLVILDSGGNPNAANGRDFGFVMDQSYSCEKPTQRTPKLPQRRRYSLPPTLTPANEDAEFEVAAPPISPQPLRPRGRRFSLDLWRHQEVMAQEEASQLREEIREAAADDPSPERQQQQEAALQKLVASQIKRKMMQLQLQQPEFELKVDTIVSEANPASCSNHRRRSRTASYHLPTPAPITSCNGQKSSRWNFAAPHSMTHASSSRMPANLNFQTYGDGGNNCSIDGEDELYGIDCYSVPRRSASAGIYRARSSSNASSCIISSAVAHPEVVVPRFTKAPTCLECDCTFDFLLRRHHCRQCGNSFCFEHSTRQLALPHLGYMTAQRVCDMCFETHIQVLTSHKLSTFMRHPTDELSTSSFASSPRGIESNDSYCGLDSPNLTAARVGPLHA